ncbi:DNA-binding protein HU (plasmid) [Deinococcus aetherius]|uniref:DNA-binding protein HU n=1 Tax=Deinococcus aetherius TaxID=200252 RepID=A0ABM8ALW2_9DEIO|nr:HU family DNA-binding protein [Deinococcus aetherius]BDP44820.1 DNA-binding protein HU [Deinococcus aetherius]
MRTVTKTSKKAPANKPAATPAEPAGQVESGTPGKVTKTTLVDAVVTQTGLTKKQADGAVDAALGAVADALRQGQSVGLPGVGTLSVKATAARSGVRPGTTERIEIPAGKKVAFKVASTLKDSLR